MATGADSRSDTVVTPERTNFRRFLTNVLQVGGGGALGQVFVVAASPILTRQYSPEEFGIYAIYTSCVIILGGIACMRFEVPIPVPKRDRIAVDLARLAIISLVVVSLLAGAITIVSLQRFPSLIPSMPAWLGGLLIILGVIGYGGYQLLNFWAIRRQLYRPMAQTRITRGVMQVMLQISGGFAGIGAPGLVLGHALGHLSGLYTIGRDLLSALLRSPVSQLRLLRTARRYGNYAKYSMPAALLSSATLQLPAAVLAFTFGPAVAGIYAIAQRVIATPASIVGTAISQVFMGETMSLARSSPARMRRLYTRALLGSAATGFIPISLIAFGGPSLFASVLGSDWAEAGQYVRVMSPMFIFQFAVYPVSQTLHAIERPDLQLVFDACRLTLGIGPLIALSYLSHPPLNALLGYSAGMVASYILYITLGYVALSQKIRSS